MNDPKRFKFDTRAVLREDRRGDGAAVLRMRRRSCSRTMQFVERCNLKLTKVDNPFPEFAVPEGHTIDSYFEQVCREGFRKRLDTAIRHLQDRGLLRQDHRRLSTQRLERELAIIKQMKFPGYFLIVWDFIRYAKEQEIPVGPGRGSAAGSLVAYVHGDHRHRSAAERAALRALPES